MLKHTDMRIRVLEDKIEILCSHLNDKLDPSHADLAIDEIMQIARPLRNKTIHRDSYQRIKNTIDQLYIKYGIN